MKRKNIILISILIISFLLIIILLIYKKDNNYEYLILDNYYSFEYKEGKFLKANYTDLIKKEYAGFSNNEFIGYYKIYALDDNNNYYFTNDDSDEAYLFEYPYLFATSGIEVINYSISDATVEDLTYVSFVANKDFSSLEELDTFKKVEYDIDNDSEDEYIYYASLESGDDSFSCIFLVDDNKAYLMGISQPFYAYEEDSIETIDYYSLGYLLKIDDEIYIVISMKSTDTTYYSIIKYDEEIDTIFGGLYG